MHARPDPDEICPEIAAELRDIARWLAGGDATADQFRQAVEMIAARKLARFGLRLRSSVSPDGIAHFTLRFAETDELCTSIDVDPRTGHSSRPHESAGQQAN